MTDSFIQVLFFLLAGIVVIILLIAVNSFFALEKNSSNVLQRIFGVLSMGAGSIMISHANDAYFRVITKFSGLEMKPMLKVYSVAAIWMGLVTLLVVYLLSLLLL
jgi:H+/gluconate symporter-like permease